MTDPNTLRAPVETDLSPAERPGLLPEGDTLIANFDGITKDLLKDRAATMIAEAETYLAQVAGESDTPPDTTHTTQSKSPGPLTALSAAFAALTLEVGEVGEVHGLLSAVHPDRTIRTEAGKLQAEIQEFADSIFSDPKYDRVYDALQSIDPTDPTLDPQDRQRYDYYIKRFQDARRAPASEAAENPRQALATAQKEFKENAAKSATITISQEEFESLPESTRAQIGAIKQADDQAGGYSVTLSQANLNYILENGAKRTLRKRAYESYYGGQAAGNDQLVQQMADLRQTIAAAQGKESWTEVQVEGLTLDTPEKVADFVNSVKGGIVQRYQATVAKLQSLLDADIATEGVAEGVTNQIQEYDLDYYKNKLIAESYDASNITFSFKKTIRGLYDLAGTLLGVKIEELPIKSEAQPDGTPVWANGVRAYAVRDATSGEDLGTIFVDPFTRQDPDGQGGKRKSGATYSLRYGRTDETPGDRETNQLPIATVVTNFKAPSADGTEAKMTMREVETLSHEALGHALHIILARTRGPEFAGDKLPFDTIEIVSQAFEYLVKDPGVLQRFADVGTPPEVMGAFLRDQDTVQQDVFALNDMRLLRTTAFDLAMHATRQPDLATALSQVAELMEPVGTDGHWMRLQTHWANPYAGRFHTYLLSSDRAKNVAALLRQSGYSPEIGAQLRAILELGGQPGAADKLLAFAARAHTPRGVGGVALS